MTIMDMYMHLTNQFVALIFKVIAGVSKVRGDPVQINREHPGQAGVQKIQG